MKLTLEHIDKTINSLDRLMPAKLNKKSTREYSLKEGVFLMADKLLEKREMGCTTNELVKALAEEEIVIKGATLNHYLCEYQKKSQSAVADQPESPTESESHDSGGDKSGNEKSSANHESFKTNLERQDTPKEGKPAVAGQYAERANPDFSRSAEKHKPASGQYAERPKADFGLSDRRGDNG